MQTIHFKDENNIIYGFDIHFVGDDTYKKFIQDDWIEITQDEAMLRANQPSPFHEWQEATQSWYLSSEGAFEKVKYEREHLPDITQKQLRLTLIKHGILPDQVEAKIAAIPDDENHTRIIAQTEWQYAQSFERMSANLNMIAKDLLGMDDEEIDAMWQEAMKI